VLSALTVIFNCG